MKKINFFKGILFTKKYFTNLLPRLPVPPVIKIVLFLKNLISRFVIINIYSNLYFSKIFSNNLKLLFFPEYCFCFASILFYS